MCAVEKFFRRGFFEAQLDLKRILAGGEAGTVRDAKNMRVDGDGRVAEGDVHHHIRGLASYTRQLFQRVAVFGQFPHARAKITSVDVSAAEKVPGVLYVEDRTKKGGWAAQSFYAGQPVVGIAAETEEALDDALNLVKVEYQVLPHVVTAEDAKKPGAPLALDYALDVLEGAALPAPASLVLISPAIAITPAAVVADWKARLSAIPGLEKLAWTQILPEFDPYKYNSFTANAAVQVHRLTRAVASRTAALASAASRKPVTRRCAG